MGGIPCLPALDPSTITSPAEGMLIFNTTDSKPEIYTGSAWEDWCTSNITVSSANDYFVIKNNIPYLPAKTLPSGTTDSGAMLYSMADHSVMLYNGTQWVKISNMGSNTFTESTGFVSLGGNIKTCKIPVLDTDPSPVGLAAGAFYINTSTKSIRYYNGAVWQNIGCTVAITTLPATSITDSTAVSGGNITSNNGSSILLRGICWNTSPNPDISLSTRTTDAVADDGIGSYNDEMKGLTPNTLYHVRAYAINSAGIAYGDDKTFTTQIAMPVIITYEASDIQNTTAITGGDITRDGGAPITDRGVYWSTQGDPLNDPSSHITHDGSGIGSFPTTLTHLLEKTTYYVRAYAVNARGKAYGNLIQFTTPVAVIPVMGSLTISNILTTSSTANIAILNNGGSPVTERGIMWSTDRVNYQTAVSTTTSDSDVGLFTVNITNLQAGTTYYVKSYAINRVGTAYSVETSFTTASWVKLTTIPASIVNAYTATSGGDVTDYGESPITKCGVCWSLAIHPDTTLTTKTVQIPTGNGLGTFASTMNGLTPDTLYYIRAYAINAKGVSYGDELTFRTPKLPTIVTTPVTNVTGLNALSGGNITSDEGQPITSRGVCWSTSHNPTVSNDNTINGSGSGTFTSNVYGLLPGTTYYVRAYAINNNGTGYGDEISFTTAVYATLTTNSVSGITNISATSGGTITNLGYSVISSQGICWSTSPDPTIASNKTIDPVVGDGLGSFTSTLTNLLGSTTYYVKAYAVNGRGVAYGDQQTFVTDQPTLATVTTSPATGVTNISAVCGGNVTSNGGALVTDSGICWSTIDPKDDSGATFLSAGAVNGSFTATLSDLLGGTTYYIRAYALNSVGRAYGDMVKITTLPATAPVFNPVDLDIANVDNTTASTKMVIVSNGGAPITESGIVWGTDKTTVKTINTKAGSGVGTFSFDLSGLSMNTTYYVQGFAVNSQGTTFTNWGHFTTTAHATVTTTDPATFITGSTAISGGTVVTNPMETLSAIGVCWSTSENPTIDQSSKTTQMATGSGVGTFISNISGLTPNTKYYVRAYATNSTGTGYGSEVSFTTASVAAITTSAASNILSSKFDIGGCGINDGGQPILEKGICWYLYNPYGSYIDYPTTKDNHVACGTGSGDFTTTLSGLLGNGVLSYYDTPYATVYYARAYATNSVGTAYGNLVVVNMPQIVPATLITTPITNIASTTAASGGTLVDTGGDPSGTRGVCWSIMENPTILDAYNNVSTGTSPFVTNAINLMGSTKYYLRAYVINGAGIAYGNQVSFTTAPPVLPTVATLDPSLVAGTTATCGGNIVSNGGAEITLRGICWSTSHNPSFIDYHADAHAAGDGSYTCDITGLTPLTTYYVRAYAFNSEGIAYGDEVSFTTFTTPTVITSSATSITNISAVSGGTITGDGGATVTSSGICWNTTGSPVTADNHTTGGEGIGNFINQIDGLLGNTTYYVRAYAINVAGTAYGDEITFQTAPALPVTLKTNPVNPGADGVSINGGGTIVNNGGAPITATGLCCGTITGFDPAKESVSRTAQTDTTSFTGTLTGLKTGTTYYVRAYAVNSAGTAYGDEVTCVTPQLPQLTTSDATTITRNSALGGGNITSDGGTPVLSSGLCWNTTGGATIADHHTVGSAGTGSFTQTMTGLLGSTTYYARAYATNGVGTAYGDDETFTTLPPVLASVKTTVPTPTSGTTANGGGTITDNGGADVTTRGIVWGTDAGFDYAKETVNRTAQTGYDDNNISFTSAMTGLTPNTIYYIRAYVINSVGSTYGDLVSFKTPSLPTISTNTPTVVRCNTAKSGGNITDNGGVLLLSGRGVLWSTIPDFKPDIQLSTTKTDDYVYPPIPVYDSNGWLSYYITYPVGNYTSALSGLKGNTTYYVRAYASNIVGTAYGNQVSFTTPYPVAPTITTSPMINISGSTATGQGSVTDDGGATVGTRGFVWSEFSNFLPDTVLVNKTTQTGYTNSGAFSSNLKNLNLGTTYYIRAYGTNSAGTGYGDPISFITHNVPALVTTTPVAGSTGYAAVSGGTISDNGGESVTNRGVCWDTSPHPTIGLITKTTGDTGSPFVSKMNSLKPVTTYYVRAYATNGQGTGYGNEVSFTTPPAIPVLTTSVISATSSSTATCGGEITYDGGAPVTARGVRWSTTQNFNPDTVTDETKDGTGMGTFTSTITGLGISVTYYVRAYATNSAGTAYGNQVTVSLIPTAPILNPTQSSAITGQTANITGKITSDGGSKIITRGVCWDTSTNPTVKLKTKTSEDIPEDSLGVCSFMHNITGLAPNTKYYVRTYATNNIGTAYGLELVVMTADVPTLTSTTPVTNIYTTTATSGGQITDDGRMPILARGVCWSRYINPTVADSKTTDTSTASIGSFTANLTSLTPITTYYARAYATNGVGTAYGSQVTFTTLDVNYPTVVTDVTTSITSNTATGGGEILDTGGMPILNSGIYIGTTNPPTTASTDGIKDVGSFTSQLTGLSPATTYYVQAYATNVKGSGRGDVLSFTTLAILPQLSVAKLSNLTISTVDASATVTNNGGSAVVEQGFRWNTTGTVPTANDKISSTGIGSTSVSKTLTGLASNTKYYVWAYATNGIGTGYSTSPTIITTPGFPVLDPTVVSSSSISYTTASSSGNVTSDGGSTVTARGVCWSTTNPPTIADSHTTDGSGTGAFSSTLNNMAPGTVYYARTYATNGVGTGYGDPPVKFTTSDSPVLSTLPVSYITSNSATCGGTVSSTGGNSISLWGICWSTSPISTATTLPAAGISSATATVTNAGIGSYTCKMTPALTPSTAYYVRAFVINSYGKIFFGAPQVFNTDAIVPTPGTVAVSNISATTANASAAISSDGGGTVTRAGLCWNTTGLNPDWTKDATLDNSPSISIGGTLTNLFPSTKYYIWSYAINGKGVGYSAAPTTFTTTPMPVVATITTNVPSSINGNSALCGGNITSDGGASVTRRGVCWSTADSPTIDGNGNFMDVGSGIGNFTYTVTGLTGATTYSVRAYAINTQGTVYGNQQSFTTLALPIVTTSAVDASLVTSTTASIGGNVTSDGGAVVSKRGICWNTTGILPTTTDKFTTDSATGTGGFTDNLTGLNPITKYYARAYATNSQGTAYGDMVSFTTLPTPPTVSNVTIPSATMTNTAAVGTATVTDGGGASVTVRGLCWNTTGNPTTADNTIPDSSGGTGSFSGTLTGLTEGPTYYVRAYAVNTGGTSYSPLVNSFKICLSVTANHSVTSGAPVDKTLTYNAVNTNMSGASKCWITKNLGADYEASIAGDNLDASAGWYWQFNNLQGYQYSGTNRTPILWTTGINENSDWVSANDPCTIQLGVGWRLPTSTEWMAVDAAPQNWQKATDAYASVLKLHEAGYIAVSGVLGSRGTGGYYWSSTQSNNTTGNYLSLTSTTSGMSTIDKATGMPVRCLRDDSSTPVVPIVSKVDVLDATKTSSAINGKAVVMNDGGSTVSVRGLCWNTTGNPTITDNKVTDVSGGTGSYTNTMTGLSPYGTTYYVRGYATNGVGIGYGVQTVFHLCPDLTIIHTAGVNGAPVTKTVTYKVLNSKASGVIHCWLLQNLGADQQATAATDTSEVSAGWYWQFNRIQGYKHDGKILTPNYTWSPWNSSNNENSDWAAANDPCSLLLGAGWRLPTITEWTNVKGSPQNWASATDAYASELKIHEAGYLSNSNGALTSRGTVGDYCSSTQYGWSNYYGTYYYGQYFSTTSSTSQTLSIDKPYGFSARCLMDESLAMLRMASVSDISIPATAIADTSGVGTATGTATITLDGGSTVTDRGLCWNTTGTTPTTSDNVIKSGIGIGSFTGVLTGLKEDQTYYVRAYATNSKGISYSPDVTSFKVCPTLTIQHKAGSNGAPVDKTVTYPTISTTLSGKAACWLTQNLGADQQATSVSDATETSAGWYWQFNRSQGYKHDGTILTPAIPAWTTWTSGVSENSDWNAANDPCALELGTSWRIPTNTEWTAVDAPPQNWLSATDAYASLLKLHEAGYLNYSNGVLTSRGSIGDYWSSSQYNTTNGYLISTGSGTSSTTNASKAYACSLRCLRDQLALALPGVSDVIVPTATMDNTSAVGSATVTPDGGATVKVRGLCWNTTGTPTVADHTVPDSNGGTGDFSAKLTGLAEGPTYYVRAYATNSVGTAYSPDVTSFKICPTFTVNHTATSGAPVDKTVTYGSVSTNISGAAKCWITRNLGADLQASVADDNLDESAGWYWQFNNLQGYQYSGTTRTPVLWTTSINENSDWVSANDPCSIQLGMGWRLPTSIEWTAVNAAPQYWQKATDAYASVLKLHEAGYLTTGGVLSSRGTGGYYWSSSQSGNTAGNNLSFTSATAVMSTLNKASGLPVRCLRDDSSTSTVPVVSKVSILDQSKTGSSINGMATVMYDGGSTVSTRGLCWNTTGNPTITDSKIADVSGGTGTYTDTMTGLSSYGTTYYVRAYAKNDVGIGYGVQTVFHLCADMTVIHTAGVNGAPVTKTVTYKVLSSKASGITHCWLLQNLGADQQATAVNDNTEASAGWYWQFNRIQGYKQDGATLTPSYTWTSWISSNNENCDWAAANDPCSLLLGAGWRIPTITEWTNVNGSPQNWSNATDAYASELKLHEAGYLSNSSGTLVSRGAIGDYWSSNQYGWSNYYGTYYYGQYFSITNSNNQITSIDKPYGFTVRCLLDESLIMKQKASISDAVIPATAITEISGVGTATGTATVSLDGGDTVFDRGLCWNTTGTAPTINDNVIKSGSGKGTLTGILTGLTEGPTYYVRAYATNNQGTSYSADITSFKVCPTLTIQHNGGSNGAPVDKTVTYPTISTTLSGKAACWLTQNLGADQQATSVNDATEASAGWYWQFNRSQGYKHDGTTMTPAVPAWTTWTSAISENSDWIAANDPCALELGTSWRIPTNTEWNAVDAPPQNWLSATDAYTSLLKIHEAGYLNYTNGALTSRGSAGDYWSSSQSNTTNGYVLSFASTSSGTGANNKAYAFTLRCLRDQLVIVPPGVSDVTIPIATMTNTSAVGTATITPDGGATVKARGLCWNTTGNPTIADHTVPDSNGGTGDFSVTLTGLTEGATYYVRAYATNTAGTAYSADVSSFKICPTFTVNHTVTSGAPVDKTVTYNSVSTSMSGTAKCWITSNLGADYEASLVGDDLDESAGWYWQFNKLQGYQYSGTVRTPKQWYTSINESSDWVIDNDPCRIQLGVSWRLPTLTEWTAVDAAPQYWQKASDAFASVLKLHDAGYVTTAGVLSNRGTGGYYWSSTQNNSTTGNYLSMNSTSCGLSTVDKATGMPVRCLRDDSSASAVPVVSKVTVLDATKTSSTENGKAIVLYDGGLTVKTRGLCWNTTGNPTTTDNKVTDASGGTGSYTNTMTGLSAYGTTYYVRAYATNDVGTGYGAQTIFHLCPDMTVIHSAGVSGAPVSKTVTYKLLSSNVSGSSHCWLTQNLGADQQATSVTDNTESSAGWYWQFNRLQGYKYDGTTLTPAIPAWSTWPSSNNENCDWAAANDPCSLLLGAGWRLPSIVEWTNVNGSPQNWVSATDAYSSELKLHEAGYLNNSSGALTSRGVNGYYWSSNQYGWSNYYGTYYYGQYLTITNSTSQITNIDKPYGFSVRCLLDESLIMKKKASVSDVTIPTSAITGTTATGTATVSLDGGDAVSDRGLCWNTTGTAPMIGSDNKVASGLGVGTYSATLTGLTEGQTYYVRAYATNTKGTSYSADIMSFKVCSPITIAHTTGVNGAPVTKTVTYGTVSTSISGAAKCWITQNLGADQQAASVSDATEASAGWYWQFNRLQGYKHDGTTRTPATWNASINENTDWAPANDPCTITLGTGWRIPTNTEWTAVDNVPQYWQTASDAFASVLKLHQAGDLATSGGITNRGTVGYYWSSSQYGTNTTNSYFLSIGATYSNPTYADKAYGFSLRCLRD